MTESLISILGSLALIIIAGILMAIAFHKKATKEIEQQSEGMEELKPEKDNSVGGGHKEATAEAMEVKAVKKRDPKTGRFVKNS